MQRNIFINNFFFDAITLQGGVPPGAVLGPLLFLVYVNDIAEALHSITRLFVDDSSLAVSSTDINVIQESLLTTT